MKWVRLANAKQRLSASDSQLLYLIFEKYIVKKSAWDKISVDYHWSFIYRWQQAWCSSMIFIMVPHMAGPSHSEWWCQKGIIRKKPCTSYPLLQQYPDGCKEKLSALNKNKRMFSQGTNCFPYTQKYRHSRLIMFSINCFILLGNVPSYSEGVFPSIFQHVGSCKSF